jgi:hypothetical protein
MTEDVTADDIPTSKIEDAPMPPVEPEWADGEEVYAIYRPDEGRGDDAA